MNKNNRKVRVSELIKRELGTFFQNFAIRKNEKEYFYLTITEVDISKDLRNAIVYFSPYFPDKNIINHFPFILSSCDSIFSFILASKLTSLSLI